MKRIPTLPFRPEALQDLAVPDDEFDIVLDRDVILRAGASTGGTVRINIKWFRPGVRPRANNLTRALPPGAGTLKASIFVRPTGCR